ncbi:MAG: NAD-dependent epimerase/dehydratase family protein [Deltaproteobacteria bacterium]|nr:NAD-dependent epimerase/dehydratase family protein [Deltaproteobacteria bacterium]
MSTLAWIIGRGGLLGSSLVHTVSSRFELWQGPTQPFAWGDAKTLMQQLQHAAGVFRERAEAHDSWAIFWAAGRAVVSSTEAELSVDTEVFRSFLESVAQARPGGRGAVFFASSAGGVYGNAQDRPLTERSACVTISAYGCFKQEQERVLQAFSANTGISSLVGRISNLYGPNQNLAKPQGLISQLSRAFIFGQPAHVYVPLDTIRDYIYADDCARAVTVAVNELLAASESEARLRIFASEQPASISFLVRLLEQIGKRRVRMIQARTGAQLLQPRTLTFQSLYPRIAPRTSLLEGVKRVHEHQLALLRQGTLPFPALKVGS